MALYNKGSSLDSLERYDESIACYDEVIKLNPEDSAPWASKGDSLKDLGRHEEAEQCFAKAKELDES
jgi:tetratricopeptide (TPR) repeat protein